MGSAFRAGSSLAWLLDNSERSTRPGQGRLKGTPGPKEGFVHYSGWWRVAKTNLMYLSRNIYYKVHKSLTTCQNRMSLGHLFSSASILPAQHVQVLSCQLSFLLLFPLIEWTWVRCPLSFNQCHIENGFQVSAVTDKGEVRWFIVNSDISLLQRLPICVWILPTTVVNTTIIPLDLKKLQK